MKMPLSPRLALLALLTLPLAACEGTGLPGFGAQDEPQAEAHKGPPSVSPLEAPIETGAAEARAIATAEAQTHNTAAFSARGNEPFWAVDVAGNTAIYKTPSNQRGQAIRVNRLTFAEGVEYIGVLGGRPFAVNIRAAECRDSMSGDRFPMTATLTVSGRSERGCAGPATAEVAPAVAATRAPAPAAPRTTATRPAATRPAASPAPAATPAATTPEPAAEESPATEAPATSTPDTAAPETTAPETTAPATPPSTTESPAITTTPLPAPTTESPAPAASEPEAPATGTAPESPATVPAPTLRLPATPPGVNGDQAGDAADSPSGDD